MSMCLFDLYFILFNWLCVRVCCVGGWGGGGGGGGWGGWGGGVGGGGVRLGVGFSSILAVIIIGNLEVMVVIQ